MKQLLQIIQLVMTPLMNILQTVDKVLAKHIVSKVDLI